MAHVERAIVKGTLGGVVATRTMFTALLDVNDDALNAGYWQTYIESMYIEIQGALSDVWQTQSMELSKLEGGHWVPYDEVTIDVGGQNTGEVAPFYVAVVLIAHAVVLRHIGRKFLGGIPKAIINGNELGAAQVAAFTAALAAYLTPVEFGDAPVLTPGIVDKVGMFHPFVGGVISSLLGTCRRRKPGQGI